MTLHVRHHAGAADDVAVLRAVYKEYRRGRERVSVLRGLSMSIPRGDFLALMGPSGCGKTTLLNLICGLDRPSAGSVVIDGEEIDKLSRSQLAAWRARHVGFVFQFYHLLPALTALQNVELPLLLSGMGARDRRAKAQAALAMVGLSDRARHFPSELSGGEQQRVAIARAVVTDPSLLLCDEPSGDLDRETGDEILSLLRLLNAEYGKTIVLVTHDPSAAEYARRTLFLRRPTPNEETRLYEHPELHRS